VKIRSIIKRPYALLLAVIYCVAISGCAKKPYERYTFHGADISGNSLYLYVGHAQGYKEWTYGMSHRAGTTITQQRFYLLEYDLLHVTNSNKLKLKSIRKLFDEGSSKAFSFRLIDANRFLTISASTNQGACLQIYQMSGMSNLFVNCVAAQDYKIGNEPFIFGGARYFIENQNQLRLFDMESLVYVEPNGFLGLASKHQAVSGADYKHIKLTHDLEYLILFPDKNFGPVTLYDKAGNKLEKSLPIDTPYQFRDVETLNGVLTWLCQSTNTLIGDFQHGVNYKIQATGLPKWDFNNDRVLLIPWGFGLSERKTFEVELSLWLYKLDRAYGFTLDFGDFQTQLKKVTTRD
jgi:hypothetical protein